jgi:Zn-finger nucleic acid-binding protein
MDIHKIEQTTEMPCPDCRRPLQILEFQTSPPTQVEHCATCHGLFFNPGELEFVLEEQTRLQVWQGGPELEAAILHVAEKRVYRNCPACGETMNRVNFGGHSSVILGRCGIHGSWLTGGELKRLTLWWRTGGKLAYAEHLAGQPAPRNPPQISAHPIVTPPAEEGHDSFWRFVLEALAEHDWSSDGDSDWFTDSDWSIDSD